jgi:hypothetical protein
MNDAPISPTTSDPTAPASVAEPPVPEIKIVEILGRVDVPGARVTGKPLQNSTRWIFDIIFEGGNLEVFLINPYGRRFVSEAMSWSISPLNETAWDAKPCGRQVGGCFILQALRPHPTHGPVCVRVAIDSIHR